MQDALNGKYSKVKGIGHASLGQTTACIRIEESLVFICTGPVGLVCQAYQESINKKT